MSDVKFGSFPHWYCTRCKAEVTDYKEARRIYAYDGVCDTCESVDEAVKPLQAEIAEITAERDALREDRANIVRWLRGHIFDASVNGSAVMGIYSSIADKIERGDHEPPQGGEGESPVHEPPPFKKNEHNTSLRNEQDALADR